jgi:ubiquitin-like modifier-activating enzyme ATG7
MANTLRYQPFSSFVDVSFWSEFAKQKLDVLKLSEEPIEINGIYMCGNPHHPNLPCRMNLSSSSFHPPHLMPQELLSPGLMYNCNTIEGFKKIEKQTIFNLTAEHIWSDIRTDNALNTPSLLNRFVLFSFADLKKYHFLYLFAFPAIKAWGNELPVTKECSSITSVFTPSQLDSFRDAFFHVLSEPSHQTSPSHYSFFLAIFQTETTIILPLNRIDEWFSYSEEVRVAVVIDPSMMATNAGWPLRNFLALLHYQSQKRGHILSTVKVICLRHLFPSTDISQSKVFQIELPSSLINENEKIEATGWEKNTKGQVAARQISLADSMDPINLTETAVGLNLKLMRWRVMPSLNLEAISSLRCLLIGSGTLGCNVARALLGWGVRHISLLDNGKVSLSNPVRQSLFDFEDSKAAKFKSIAAAENLKRIYPSVCSAGYVLSIPMPGHTVGPNEVEKVKKDVELLVELYKNHDAIFLLTDSRESRWLPTLLGAALNKIVLNSAMGYDTFLCMRHGNGFEDLKDQTKTERDLKQRLGCYFCNDVVAPQDSLSDRTLDQQCTVTRPGLSYITSAMAVELVVSLLQHPLRERCPADPKRDIHTPSSTPFGNIPHQIRGYMSHFENLVIVSYAYDRCTACSLSVVNEYQKRGFEFLLEVFNRPRILEEVTGLIELQNLNADCTWDDTEFFSDEE